MGRSIQWDGDAWEDYCEWQKDKATLKRINALIKDIRRDPFAGIGKPEPLKHDLSGLWSRRMNETDRITYKPTGDIIVILACKGHYD
jgi:toxin YoeB